MPGKKIKSVNELLNKSSSGSSNNKGKKSIINPNHNFGKTSGIGNINPLLSQKITMRQKKAKLKNKKINTSAPLSEISKIKMQKEQRLKLERTLRRVNSGPKSQIALIKQSRKNFHKSVNVFNVSHSNVNQTIYS